MNRKSLPLLFFALCAICFARIDEKRTLRPNDYGQWETLQTPTISNDGHWFAYGISVVDGDGYCVVKNVDQSGKWTTMFASRPIFSDDSKWAAYLVGYTKREVDRAKDEKRELRNKLAIRNLATGEELFLPDVQSFRFLKGGRFLIAQHYRAAGKTEGGTDMSVNDLSDGSSVEFGNVSGVLPNEKENLLALLTESDTKYNGIQVYEPASQTLHNIVWSKDTYSNLVWAKKKDTLAFLKGTPDEKKEGDWNMVALAINVNTKPEVMAADLGKIPGFPAGSRIAEFGGLLLNDDASTVAFGVKDWADKKKPGKPEEKAGVDVWHWKDLDIVPKQKLMAPLEARRTTLFVWHVGENNLTQITDDRVRNATLLDDLKGAVLYDETPYKSASTNGFAYRDVYIIDLRKPGISAAACTGDPQRKLILKKTHGVVVPSPKGNYLAYYSDKKWWIYNVATGESKNVTGALGADFEDSDDDHTVPERPFAAFPVWLADDKGVLVGSHFDRWLIEEPSGKATRLTSGEKDHIRFSPLDVNRDDNQGIPIDKPIYFSAFDEDTKKAGFFVWRAGSGGKALVFDDKTFTGLAKSRDTDRMIFTSGSFTDSPNEYVTNENFDQFKPLTKTNPQQAEFLWGKTELVRYKSKWGKPLEGFLIYPADYQAGKKYPMITYIYEQLSDGKNNYSIPVDWSSYNPQVLSQNGYFVFEPDIAYHGRNPGLSAVECLEPAVDAATKAQPDIDSAHVGLMGHSWGAYQTTFVITQSKKFAAAVAGAPLTELRSMYLSIYSNSGTPDQELLETGQGRLEVPSWDDPKTYDANSPVENAAKITTPLMIAQGTADGAVDFHQGMYLFNTMRRMGKSCIFLAYEGENHGLAKRPNQLDYAHRLRHFFDVYLKGAKPEPWVTDGVPFLKKD